MMKRISVVTSGCFYSKFGGKISNTVSIYANTQYSGDLNTKLVWYSNVQQEVGFQLPNGLVFKFE